MHCTLLLRHRSGAEDTGPKSTKQKKRIFIQATKALDSKNPNGIQTKEEGTKTPPGNTRKSQTESQDKDNTWKQTV